MSALQMTSSLQPSIPPTPSVMALSSSGRSGESISLWIGLALNIIGGAIVLLYHFAVPIKSHQYGQPVIHRVLLLALSAVNVVGGVTFGIVGQFPFVEGRQLFLNNRTACVAQAVGAGFTIIATAVLDVCITLNIYLVTAVVIASAMLIPMFLYADKIGPVGVYCFWQDATLQLLFVYGISSRSHDEPPYLIYPGRIQASNRDSNGSTGTNQATLPHHRSHRSSLAIESYSSRRTRMTYSERNRVLLNLLPFLFAIFLSVVFGSIIRSIQATQPGYYNRALFMMHDLFLVSHLFWIALALILPKCISVVTEKLQNHFAEKEERKRQEERDRDFAGLRRLMSTSPTSPLAMKRPPPVASCFGSANPGPQQGQQQWIHEPASHAEKEGDPFTGNELAGWQVSAAQGSLSYYRTSTVLGSGPHGGQSPAAAPPEGFTTIRL
ncbi:hypothetical protein HK102_013734 [Quaeritorhiza haematococci]|nr:hypothetical protein HK102_013734 [Quaeritorhiza haematococci]